MQSIEELTQTKVEEVLAFLDEAPIDLIFTCINHDSLYLACEQDVINTLASLAEAKSDELKEEQFNESNR
jgi:hypothetical protein